MVTSEIVASLDDIDGETVLVEIGLDANFQPCVKLTTRADMTFAKARAYLTPAAARAIADALSVAALRVDLEDLGGDDSGSLAPDCSGDCGCHGTGGE